MIAAIRRWRDYVWQNPIQVFAMFCVACTAAFLGFISWRLIQTLSSPQWCANALQAERISPGNTFVGLTSCMDLLKIQLQTLATNSHIAIGAFALSMVVLVVIVIAGAKLSGRAFGNELNIEKDDAKEGAEFVASAAQDAAAQVPPGGMQP